MKVLQIGLSCSRGGIETMIMTYFRALQPKGITFDFVDIYGDGLAFSEEIEALGGTIYRLPNYKKHPFRAKRMLRKIIADYEIVHINMLSAANLLPFHAARKNGRTPILHSHNTGTEGIVRKVLHKINFRKIKRAKTVRLACSNLAGEWLFGSSSFEVIPNAVDCDKFEFHGEDRAKVRSQYEIADGTLLLGFVGRLNAQKNPLYLLDILKAVLEKGLDAKLVLVGDGELRQDIETAAETGNIRDRVIFVGNQADIASYYSAMDIFLLPSTYEGLGIVAIEAQANGLPCLLSDRVPEEVIASNRVSFLSIDGNAAEWADKIKEESAKPFARNNSVRGTQYDINCSAELLKRVYCDLIDDEGKNSKEDRT